MSSTMDAIDSVVSDLDATIDVDRRPGLEFAIDPSTPEHAVCDLPGGPHGLTD